jgi:hypothetical protein
MEGKCRVYAEGSGNVLSGGGGASGAVWESIDNLSKSQGGAQSGCYECAFARGLFIKDLNVIAAACPLPENDIIGLGYLRGGTPRCIRNVTKEDVLG